jgi:hypothetical protein
LSAIGNRAAGIGYATADARVVDGFLRQRKSRGEKRKQHNSRNK